MIHQHLGVENSTKQWPIFSFHQAPEIGWRVWYIFLSKSCEVVTIAWLCFQPGNNFFFVPLDFQVGTVGERYNMVAARESVIVPRWLNVIVDLNGILCSCVQKSTMTQWGPHQKLFYAEDFLHSTTILTCVGPKVVYVCQGLANFIRRVTGFANITVWSSMMQSTTGEVMKYLFYNNVKPVAMYKQESYEPVTLSKLMGEKS